MKTYRSTGLNSIGVLWCLCLWWLAQTAQASLLWQIEKDGRRNHVLGTFHVSDPEIVTVPPHVNRIVVAARQLVLEVRQDSRSQQIIADRSLLTQATLSQLLGPELYEQVVQAMRARGMAPAGVQRLKPWAVGLMLNFPAPSLDPVLDVSLQYRFQAQNKPVQALETIDEQLDVFDHLPLADQIQFLASALEQLPDFDRNLEQMKNLYKAGDLEAIQHFAQAQMKQTDSAAMTRLMHAIIDQRNQRMYERMQPYLQQSDTLIAVGALHLPGNTGVLQLLKNNGYRIRPVNP